MAEREIDSPADQPELDPREAAQLLAQSEQRVRDELNWRSPWLTLFAAVGVFIAFGVAWLTVRGQHPYKGPTELSLVVIWVFVAIRIGTVIYSHRRATSGVSGRSVRQTRAEGIALLVALVAVYVVMGALKNAGAGDGVVYGTYVVTATMLVLGVFGAACFAAHEDRERLAVSIAIIVVTTGCAFASPRGVWLANGIGCAAVLLVYSALQATVLQGSRHGA